VLVIGLDAMEAPFVERGFEAGAYPALARIHDHSVRFVLTNPMRSHPGAIWPEINTGRSVGAVGLYFHPSQLHTGDDVPHKIETNEIDPRDDWWHVAGDHGRRICVVDVPHSVTRPGTNGIHVTDWGNHDRSWEPDSDPPSALTEIRAHIGDHPIGRCDDVVRGGDANAFERLLDELLEGIERRTQLGEWMLAREDWDVVHLAFTESHCVGHQFWAFENPGHPVPLPDRPPRLQRAIAEVYGAIDAGIARLTDAAGPDATVVVIFSHGMGPYVGGYQLIPEVLVRLGLRPAPSAAAAAPTRLPERVRRVLRRVVPDGVRYRRIARAGTLAHHDLASPRTKATVLLNNRCAAIRLNLRGREPHGRVEPGTEATALLDELRRELHALRQPGTGEPIVDLVATRDELFGADAHPDLPDLTVGFRTDLGPIEVCESPRVGRIEVPLWSRATRADGWPVELGRTGDHTDASRLWIRAPGRAPYDGGEASVLDIAPTVLALVDVPPALGMTGLSLVDAPDVRSSYAR
jgi:predicted AlkP superfamily phosphohydrolase/phosphomutase